MTHPIHFLNIATTATVGASIMLALQPEKMAVNALTAALFVLALLAIAKSFRAMGEDA